MACDGGQIKAAATGIRGATTSRGRADDRAASTPVELGPVKSVSLSGLRFSEWLKRARARTHPG